MTSSDANLASVSLPSNHFEKNGEGDSRVVSVSRAHIPVFMMQLAKNVLTLTNKDNVMLNYFIQCVKSLTAANSQMVPSLRDSTRNLNLVKYLSSLQIWLTVHCYQVSSWWRISICGTSLLNLDSILYLTLVIQGAAVYLDRCRYISRKKAKRK